MGLSCTGLDAVLVEAMKEQHRSLDTKDRKIASLQTRLDRQEARIRRMEAMLGEQDP